VSGGEKWILKLDAACEGGESVGSRESPLASEYLKKRRARKEQSTTSKVFVLQPCVNTWDSDICRVLIHQDTDSTTTIAIRARRLNGDSLTLQPPA
jgi:hypothetical protein